MAFKSAETLVNSVISSTISLRASSLLSFSSFIYADCDPSSLLNVNSSSESSSDFKCRKRALLRRYKHDCAIEVRRNSAGGTVY